MKGKMAFVVGAAIGYVLGARAGRQRYEQIKGAASKVWQSPGIQKQVQQAQDYAAKKVGEVPGALIDGAKKAVASVGGRNEADSTSSAQSSSAQSSTAKSETSTASKPASTKPATRKPAAKKPAGRTSTTAKRGNAGK